MTDPLDTEETQVFKSSALSAWLATEAGEETRVAAAPRALAALRERAGDHVDAARGGASTAALAVPPHVPPMATRPPPTLPPRAIPAPAAESASPAAADKKPDVVPTQSPLFRQEAMRAYSQGHSVAAPLDVAPMASRVLFLALLMVAACALALAAIGEVELTSLGRGILRAPEGVQPITSPLAGVVAEVLVEAGASVAPGQVLLRIDSTQYRAQWLDAERKLAAMEARHLEESVQEERLHREATQKLRKRHALMERRIKSQRRGVSRLEKRAERFRLLAEDGLSEEGLAEEAGEALDNAERSWLALQDQLALADVERTRLNRELEAGRAQRREERERMVSERDAARLLLDQTELRASRHGKVEGLRVSVGQQVQPGAPLARLVPLGRPRGAVAFIPERDRAFLSEGRSVRLELDRLPVGEFGSVAARVARISDDVATAEDLETHLGESAQGAFFRVDLLLDLDASQAELEQYLQSGTLVTVRAPLRSRRILSLMFDPIRRVLD
jgi:multidrug resistance efflux pump